jgi:3-isopropylmalate/(R)-2-methylmalate dehydratase large subunit
VRLAHGIGTSEVEHVLATQTLLARKAKNSAGPCRGPPAAGRQRQGHRLAHRPHRHGRGTGYTIEFAGSAIRACRWKAA